MQKHTQTHTHMHIYTHTLQYDIPSSDTNCPITEAPPAALSWNWISETMSCSSSTEPQFVQTLSPRVASSSISLQPQCLHTRSGMMLQFNHCELNKLFPIVIFLVKLSVLQNQVKQHTCTKIGTINSQLIILAI